MKSKQAHSRESEEARVVADTVSPPRTGRRRIQLLTGDDAAGTLQDLTDEGRQQEADYLRMRWQRDLSLGIAAATFVGFVGVLWWLSGLTRSSSAATPVPATLAIPDPEPIAELASDGVGETRGEIVHAVEAWATAWSSQDVASYLGFYAADFRVPGGSSREDWEARRQTLIGEPRLIAITLADLKVELTGPNSATARFAQTYVAPGYGDRVLKTLTLVKEEERWRILEEVAKPIPN